jgi:hypothetical protein
MEKTLPLALCLSPVLPLRAPEPGVRTETFGYRLRLPGGPALADDDVLLATLGALVVELLSAADDREALQDAAFAPGRRLALLEEGVDEDGDPVVGVWDATGVRRAGHLHFRAAAAMSAAAEVGLGVEAVVLTEDRTRVDDRRSGLRLLVHAPAIVRVELDADVDVDPDAGDGAAVARRSRPRRERVVLVADGKAEPRWWDPSGRTGPMELDDVPLSPGLVADLKRTVAAYAAVRDDEDLPADAVDAIEQEMYRSSLEARMRELWQRARAELGRAYAIGLLGPGMTRPEWTPSAPGDEDDDIPF